MEDRSELFPPISPEVELGVSVDQMITQIREKRSSFGVGQEPKETESNFDQKARENIEANTDRVLPYLEELRRRDKGSFFSFDQMIQELNELASEEENDHFLTVGDHIDFPGTKGRTSGKIVRLGESEEILDWYFDNESKYPLKMTLFSGSNFYDNPPSQFPQTLFLPIVYVMTVENSSPAATNQESV
jgi:hypothetical protein